MRFFSTAVATMLAAGHLVAAGAAGTAGAPCKGKITPKFFIISLFTPEADIWYDSLPGSGLGDLFAHNITTPGLSMLFPHVHCVEDFSICQMTAGEGEINAASTVMAVTLSGLFDLTNTYFMIAGIAGVSPKYGTLGTVALGRYTVQVALQYEFDAREMPANWSTGYFGYDTSEPNIYPGESYGTEVFELSADLLDAAYGFASKANLSDDPVAAEYRTKYAAAGEVYLAGTETPSVVKCDSATSDVYYSGTILGEAFEKVVDVWTNGTGKYCMTAQEDSAVLEVLVRMGIEGIVDFSRVILMRTGSDFDRQPPSVTAFDNLRIVNQNGFEIAIENIFNAGVEIVRGILEGWESTFKAGLTTTNYIGDIFGSLGGEPDFGLGSTTDGEGYKPKGASSDKFKRGLSSRMGRKGGYAKRQAVKGGRR